MAKKPEQPPCKEEKTNRWMLTFADVITLLMCFFIFLVTYATLETANLEQVQAYLVSSLGIVGNKAMHDRTTKGDTDFFPSNPESHEDGERLRKGQEDLGKRLDLLAKKWDADTLVDLRRLVPRLEIRMLRHMKFPPDSDVLPRQQKFFLDDLALILRQHSCRLVIQGYSDDLADLDIDDPDGFHVATGRAANVAEYLATEGEISPLLITIESFGKFSPRGAGTSPLERAKRRSVGFYIVSAEKIERG